MLKTTLHGHLAENPVLTHLPNGTPLLTLDVIAKNGYVDNNGNWQENINNVRLSIFGPYATNVAQRGTFKKGHLIYAECTSNNNAYTRADGTQVYGMNHTVDKIERLRKTFAEMQQDRQNSNLGMNVPQSLEHSSNQIPETVGPVDDDIPF